MSKTRFIREKNRNILLFQTSVENLFISELLPAAPGDYVKVYLFGLMNSQYDDMVDNGVTANVLNLSWEDIEKAWAYWEDKGAVRRTENPATGDVQIRFVSQIEEIFGTEDAPASGETPQPVRDAGEDTAAPSPEERSEASRLEEIELRGLYSALEEATGRPISEREMEKIRDAIRVYGVTPDVFAYAIQYCAEIDKYNINYISKVALRWTEEGCRDIAQVRARLDEESKRNASYHRIFHEIGFQRLPSPADREMMSRWLDDMGFSLNEVLDACRKTAGMREPSLRYINKILENKLREAGGIDTKNTPARDNDSYQRNVSKRVLGEYYEYLRNNAEIEHQEHIEEVCRVIPKMNDLMALEKELNKAIMTFDFSSRSRDQRKIQIQRRRELDRKKQELLESNGYPADYLDKKFRCEQCKDTGVTDDGKYCSCVKERVDEAYTWNLKRTK